MAKRGIIIFIVCLLGAFFARVLYKKYEKKEIMPGCVIIIDGASCSGKSSVVQQLKPMLDSSCHYLAVDDFVSDVFIEQQKLHLSEREFLARVNHQTDVMYEKIRTLVASGKNVILDTVLCGLEGKESVKDAFEQLDGMLLMLVLVHCPLPGLAERITKRNEQAERENKPNEMRSVGTMLSQFGNMYQQKTTSDIVGLEKLSRHDVELACAAGKKEWGEDLAKFESFKRWLLLQLGLHDAEIVTLAPRLKYNCIVNTRQNTPCECAQQIKQKIQEHKLKSITVNFG